MKTKSRFLALLLALILLLAVPCAVADEAAVVREEVGTAEDYVNLLRSVEKPYYPETVVFTDAGPFLPAVNVGGKMLRAARANDGTSSDDGLKLSKTATVVDGGYKIRLEAYTTGKVTTTTRTTPVDIVLVLDQSGSMAYDFDGNSTNNNTERRQYAMKQAVNIFIDAVNEKYDEKVADHRMAIVTFAGGEGADYQSKILKDWTEVNDAGMTALQRSVSGLSQNPSGATNVGAGMQQAETLMGESYNYKGDNKSRQRVVIVFTDGVPTEQSNFSVTVANNAITSAKKLKDSMVTVYTIGIFNGADPDRLHGDKYYRLLLDDDICDGSVGSFWGTTRLGNSNKNDFADPDMPAGDRFLNFVSNNFDASEIGIEFNNKDGLMGGYKWIITKNFARKASGYYLTANNSASLDSIFTEISENIQTADIDLGSKTIVKDIVSPYFEIPKNVSDIGLFTDDYNGTDFANSPQEATGVTATINSKTSTLSVTGFDFNKNFVTDKQKDDGTYGRKLIIEFTVRVKDGFLGGNDVPTNAGAGIYENEKAETPIKKFNQPTVNVPIPDVTVTAEDKNVYLLGEVTLDQLKTGATVKVGDIELDLSKANDKDKPYGLEPWQTAYVGITVEVKDEEGKPITGALTNLTEDTTYTIQVTVSPKKSTPSSEQGEEATKKTGSATNSINVYKPEVTFKDSEINLDDIPNYGEQNHGNPFEVWKHGELVANPDTMIGNAPTLTYDYVPSATVFTEDQPVKVTAKIDDVDRTEYVTFYRDACTYCSHNTREKVETAADGTRTNFIVHVKSFDLKIVKTGWESLDENQSFLFTVSDGTNTLDVVIHGDGVVTIKGLSAGKKYTVTENIDWSWRYKPTDDNLQTVNLLTAEDGVVTVTFNNTRSNDKWLDGNAYCDNKWIDNSSTDKKPD